MIHALIKSYIGDRPTKHELIRTVDILQRLEIYKMVYL